MTQADGIWVPEIGHGCDFFLNDWKITLANASGNTNIRGNGHMLRISRVKKIEPIRIALRHTIKQYR
jgi:hypothetical protein